MIDWGVQRSIPAILREVCNRPRAKALRRSYFSQYRKSIRNRWLGFGLLIFLFGGTTAWCPAPVAAARYHVRDGGTRENGPSTPGIWSFENCYESLVLALREASISDSLLLYKEVHIVTTPLQLITHLANQDLDGNYAECQVQMQATAQLHFNPLVSQASVVGISFVSSRPPGPNPTFWLANTNQQPEVFSWEDCAFTNHHTSEDLSGGSCIHAPADGNGMSLIFNRCTFRGNSSHGKGGAVLVTDNYTVQLNNCDLVNNECYPNQAAAGTGGALTIISQYTASSLSLSYCHFDSNRAWGPGGGLAVVDANATLQECDIIANESGLGSTGWSAGAGLFMTRDGYHYADTNLDITQCRFIANKGHLDVSITAADGGGVLVKGYNPAKLVDVHVTNSFFQQNFNAQGAGLYMGRYTNGLVERCTFFQNTAYTNGGASYKGGAFPENLGETATFLYCDFIANQAGYDENGEQTAYGGRGGAFMTRLHPRADFLNCSFSNNRSGGEDERGDAIYHWNEIGFFNDPLQLCSLVNCAFWGTNGLDVQIYSDPHGFSSVSFCAFGVGEYYCIGVEPTSTVTLTQSPYVSTLDLHLYSESPCIDQGLDLGPNADIEGILVPQGLTTDIGAHEYLDPSGVTSSPPSAFMLKAFPNPFNPRTTIQFELLQPAETVRLAVYDPGGRFVALLSEGPREAGRHLITWEGRNEEGRTVPAGLYLARLDAGNLSRTIKILLVR